MTIENGELANADEILNSVGKIFGNSMQPIYDIDKNGWNSNTNEIFTNLSYSGFPSDDMNTTGSIYYDANRNIYFSPSSVGSEYFYYYDNFGNSTLDTTKWVSGIGGTTPGESSITISSNILTLDSYQTNQDDNTNITVDTSGNNLISSGTYIMLEIGSMYSEIFETTDPGAASTYIKFGNTTIGATSMAGSGLDGESNTIYEFNIFDDFAYHRKYNGASWSNWSGISYTGSEKISLYTAASRKTSSNSRALIRVNSIIYSNFSGTLYNDNIYLTSPFISNGSIITNNIINYNSYSDSSSNSDITPQSSYNSGINFDDDTINKISRHINTGSYLQTKFIFHGQNYLNGYGNIYNLY